MSFDCLDYDETKETNGIKTQIGARSEKLFPEAPFFDPTRVVDPRPLAHGSPPPSTAAASSNARPNSVKGSVLIVTSR